MAKLKINNQPDKEKVVLEIKKSKRGQSKTQNIRIKTEQYIHLMELSKMTNCKVYELASDLLEFAFNHIELIEHNEDVDQC